MIYNGLLTTKFYLLIIFHMFFELRNPVKISFKSTFSNVF